MCDVPSIAVFCSESIEWFPGIVSKFSFKLLVTIPVAPIITGTIVHLRFHIRCISIHKLLYFNFFSASFCTTFLSAGIATSISVHVFSFLFLLLLLLLLFRGKEKSFFSLSKTELRLAGSPARGLVTTPPTSVRLQEQMQVYRS